MMNLKNILLPFQGESYELPALNSACLLAKKFDAHVNVLHVSLEPRSYISAGGAALGVAMPAYGAVTTDIEKENTEQLEYVSSLIKNQASQYKLSFEDSTVSAKPGSVSLTHKLGCLDSRVKRYGKLSDLIVMSRVVDFDTLYEESHIVALFDTGKPVLFAPCEQVNDIANHIVVAWDGSAEATRAISTIISIIHLLRNTPKLYVLEVDQHEDLAIPSIHEVIAYLKSHNVLAESITVESESLSTGAAILEQTKILKADLLVMGGYTHSRLRQMIIGGTTRHMLEHAHLPVLMIH